MDDAAKFAHTRNEEKNERIQEGGATRENTDD